MLYILYAIVIAVHAWTMEKESLLYCGGKAVISICGKAPPGPNTVQRVLSAGS